MKQRVETNIYKREAIATDIQGVATSVAELTAYFNSEMSDMQQQVDGKIETYYQANDPSTRWTNPSEHEGDIWYNTVQQKTYRFDGSGWTETKTTPPAAILDEIDGKATVYVGTTTPQDPSEKDLWFKGVEEGIYTYVGGEWIEYNKYTDDTTANTAVTLANTAQGKADTAYNRASAEYGVCNVSASTKAKTVTVENFTLYIGATCSVTFTNKNTATNPTLNVNGTGAKTIYARGSGLAANSRYNWQDGATVRFVYDGTYWVMMPMSTEEAVNVLAGNDTNSPTQIMYVDNGQVKINADHISTGSLDASIIATTELNAANITVGKIQGEQIEVDAITAVHLATDSVTADAIKANSVGTSELQANSVTANEIVAGTITATELATNSVTADKIEAGAITSQKIQADAITATHLATDSVTADAIKANSVGTDELQANCVTANEIQANAITTEKIETGAITSSKIESNAITADKIEASAITTSKIATDAITADKIATDAVTADAIKANSVGTSELQANSVTATEIASKTITANEIAANAITSEKIEASAVTAVKIASSAITTDKISGSAVTSAKIANNNVTVAKMSGSITNGDWSIDFTNGTMSIGTLTADDIIGGTLKLGGRSNVNGELSVYNSSGTRVGHWNNTGAYFGNIASSLDKAYLNISTTGILTSYEPSTGFRARMSQGGFMSLDSSNNYAALQPGLVDVDGSMYIFNNRITYNGTEYCEAKVGTRISTAQTTANNAQSSANTALSYAKASTNESLVFKNILCTGHLTSSKKQICFFVPSYKNLAGMTAATATMSGSMYIRHVKGGTVTLAYGGSASPRISSFSCAVGNAGVWVNANLNAELSSDAINNSPVTVAFQTSLTLKVS